MTKSSREYHVRYYYLASGMEGRADKEDYGIIKAGSGFEALEYVVNNLDPIRLNYSVDTSEQLAYRHWGLTAEEVELEEVNE